MNREGNSNNNSKKAPAHNAEIDALASGMSGVRVGTAEAAVIHEAPAHVRKFITRRKRYGTNKFTLAKSKLNKFKRMAIKSVPVEQRRFPRKNLLHRTQTTTRMNELRRVRRIKILGLKKLAKSKKHVNLRTKTITRKSTRRTTGK